MRIFLSKKYPPVPWIEYSQQSPRGVDWSARANWGVYAVLRGGKTEFRAKLNALVGVLFYRLLQPFSRKWIREDKDIWPRWYFWLVRN